MCLLLKSRLPEGNNRGDALYAAHSEQKKQEHTPCAGHLSHSGFCAVVHLARGMLGAGGNGVRHPIGFLLPAGRTFISFRFLAFL